MNYNSMTSRELLHYLDLYSTDPVVQRLVKLLQEESVVQELVDAGMDPVTRTFEDDWEKYSPGQYIEQLRINVNSYRQDAEYWEANCDRAEQDRDKFKARSVAKLLMEAENERASAYSAKAASEAEVRRLQKLNDDLTEKIDMWGKMNKVY